MSEYTAMLQKKDQPSRKSGRNGTMADPIYNQFMTPGGPLPGTMPGGMHETGHAHGPVRGSKESLAMWVRCDLLILKVADVLNRHMLRRGVDEIDELETQRGNKRHKEKDEDGVEIPAER
jgi:hypothetical protein